MQHFPRMSIPPSKVLVLSFPTFSEQIIWFSAMFPYVVLTILAVKALSLEGAWEGIKFLFTPDWERLTKSECWIDGGTQVKKGKNFQSSTQITNVSPFTRSSTRTASVSELSWPLDPTTSSTRTAIGM